MSTVEEYTPHWDQTLNIVKHVNDGLWLTEMDMKFHNELAKVFSEYSKNLKKACVKYKKIVKQRNTSQAQSGMMLALLSTLNQYESIADFAQAQETQIQLQIKSFKAKSDSFRQQADKKRADLISAEDILQASKNQIQLLAIRYQDSLKDLQRSLDTLTKAQENINLSQKDVEKVQDEVTRREKDFLNAEKVYRTDVEKFNLFQHEHYSLHLGTWVEQCRRLDEDRYQTQSQFRECMVNSLEGTSERYRVAADNVKETCAANSFTQDWAVFRESIISTKAPPVDIIPIELENPLYTEASRSSATSRDSAPTIVTEPTAAGSVEGKKSSSSSLSLFRLFRKNTITENASPPTSSNITETKSIPVISPPVEATQQLPQQEDIYDNYAPTTPSMVAYPSAQNEYAEPGMESVYAEPIIGQTTCVALYSLDADPEHDVLQMHVNESFFVLQAFIYPDWHQVRSLDGVRTGVVPANYVSIQN